MAHKSLGLLLQNHRNDSTGAEREFGEAIRLNPNNSMGALPPRPLARDCEVSDV